MKSQFYTQVSHNSLTRKSTTNQKNKKQSHNSITINPMILSKAIKSEKRSLIHSIDLMKKSKQDKSRMMKMSYSKPLIIAQTQIQQIEINEKSVLSVCLKCQQLKSEHQKDKKLLKMKYEQMLTEQAQRFINMEKKYLMKEKENIKILTENNTLLSVNQELKEIVCQYEQRIEELKYKCLTFQQEIAKLEQELRKEQEKNRIFSHFLTVFVQQTKSMLSWTNLFENTDEPEDILRIIKQELQNKKVDLELMLKQSIIFKKDNFGEDSIRILSHQSSFFGSEIDGSESFMKYLRQQGATKTKQSKQPHFSQIKGRSYISQSFTTNKQNIDTSNKLNFKSLIQSRLNSHIEKQRSEHAKDQYLRMLLTQAQSLQQKNCFDSQRSKVKSKSKANQTILSSMRKQYEISNQ